MDRHAGRSGLPHEGDFGGGEAVGLVDEVAELPFELEGFGGEGAGGVDGAGVFGPEVFDASGGERVFFAADFFHLADQGVGVEFGQGLEFVGGFSDGVFDAEPVQDGAQGLLLGNIQPPRLILLCCTSLKIARFAKKTFVVPATTLLPGEHETSLPRPFWFS